MMMDRSETYAGRVRALFERMSGVKMAAKEIYAHFGSTTPTERHRVRGALRDLTESGYLSKDGSGRKAVFEASGNGMRRTFVVTAEQRERCRVDKAMKQAAYRASKRASSGQRAPDKMTINRSRVGLLADLAPAKPWGKEKVGQRPAETVEQFEARGGQVQRLAASWEQRA